MLPRRASLARLTVLVAVLLLPAIASGDWGADTEKGEGPKMIQEVQGDLLKIVKAPPGERAAKIQSFFQRGAKHMVEALKRFRNPEIRDLFRAFLDHPDWHVQHRGLLALEYLDDPVAVERAWGFLEHPQRRMREKAAITLIKLWSGGKPPVDLDALLRRERDFHVRRCLEALERRAAGKLTVDKVYQEVRVTLPNGLVLTPFLDGMGQLSKVAPDYRPKPVFRSGKGSASRLPPTDRWTTPLLGFFEEEIPGMALQPFGNLRQDGTVYHVGQDAGACLDGAGLYAAAAGVVKLIHTGSDMGTLIVIEHHLPGGRLVTSLFMHGGDTVFVKAGDVVSCGQLIGTVGLGFSIENGGHFAHLHYGLYPGPYDVHHNYGYKPVSQGLADWIDPSQFLQDWQDRTAPVVPDILSPDPSLDDLVGRIAAGEYGRAYEEARRRRDAQDRHAKAWADADELVQALETLPHRALRRADALVDGGYPAEAVGLLKDLERAAHGIPGLDRLDRRLDDWKGDDAFQRGLKGEKKVAAAEAKAEKERDPAKRAKIWEKIREEYASTCLAARIPAAP